MGERHLGPYRLEQLIGRGGMGEVYRAVDTRKNRAVALKVLPSAFAGDVEFVSRFRREAEVTAQLHEPHVIPIHDYGKIEGQLFLDMRFVQGTNLESVLRRSGRLPPHRAVDLVGQVAAALDAAHRAGLVHRDVKPSNVLLTDPHPEDTADAPDFVYLIDFGIAANVLDTRLTPTSATLGTAAYMAPERFLPGPGGDGRVDVYALGCVLFELLTGKRPFAGESFPQLMYAHLNVAPSRLSEVEPNLPAGLEEVVAAALEKDAARRPHRAGDLATRARAALARSASPPPATPRAGRPAAAPRPAAGSPSIQRHSTWNGPRPYAPLPTGPPPGPPSGRPPGPPKADVAAGPVVVDRRPDEDEPPPARAGRARRWALWLGSTAAAIVLSVLAATVYLSAQYYVASDADTVVIYQGLPGSLLGVSLQSVAEDSGLRVADLTPVARQQLAGDGIRVDDLASAWRTVDRLRSQQTLPPCTDPSASGSEPQVPGRDCRNP
ncbi:hypothetical protein GCM10023200_32750 [Actinomycetospora chlora]|uniref:non-specific serine/threonine protein kinase n=1 Tax=Actinomycetospora chlora TaxID=663608 RepID=A0ABP9BHH9_9PSEU